MFIWLSLLLWVYNDSRAFQCRGGAEGGDDTRSVHHKCAGNKSDFTRRNSDSSQLGFFHYFKLLGRVILMGRTLLKLK